MLRLYVLTCIVLLYVFPVYAQKMLLFEQANKVKPKKYYPGDVITFQKTDGYRTWYTERIRSIDVEKQEIEIGSGTVALSEIRAVRKARRGLGYLGKQGLLFGVQAGFYSGIAIALGDDKRQAQKFAIGAGGFALGSFLVSRIFKYKKRKLGGRYRLRIVEVPVVPLQPLF
jgi:hypothetical protein